MWDVDVVQSERCSAVPQTFRDDAETEVALAWHCRAPQTALPLIEESISHQRNSDTHLDGRKRSVDCDLERVTLDNVMGTNGASDLQAILDNLAQFAPTANTAPSWQRAEAQPHHARTQVPQIRATDDQSSQLDRALQPQSPRPQGRSTASPKPLIDPATITTWQEGLRCVTKLAAQNVHFAAGIRRVSLSPYPSCQCL